MKVTAGGQKSGAAGNHVKNVYSTCYTLPYCDSAVPWLWVDRQVNHEKGFLARPPVNSEATACQLSFLYPNSSRPGCWHCCSPAASFFRFG